jgi:hypothetical protein
MKAHKKCKFGVKIKLKTHEIPSFTKLYSTYKSGVHHMCGAEYGSQRRYTHDPIRRWAPDVYNVASNATSDTTLRDVVSVHICP